MTVREVYATGRGRAVVRSERPRGPFEIELWLDDGKGRSNPKHGTKSIGRITETRTYLRGLLGPLRKASNPSRAVELSHEAERLGALSAEKYMKRKGDRMPSRDWLREASLRAAKKLWGRSKSTRTDLIVVGSGWRSGFTKRLAGAPVGEQERIAAIRRGEATGGVERWNPRSVDSIRADIRRMKEARKPGFDPEWSRKFDALMLELREAMGIDDIAGKPKRRRRNPPPGLDSDRLYEDFHGKPPTQTTVIETEVLSRDDVALLGPLSEIEVKSPAKRSLVKIPLDPDGRDRIMLTSSPDGRQLYFDGGDQTMDLAKFGMNNRRWKRDHMTLGVLHKVQYRTRKGFDEFELIDYHHELGEDSGEQPMLCYDNLNAQLSVWGGQYEVKPEGIVN